MTERHHYQVLAAVIGGTVLGWVLHEFYVLDVLLNL